MLKVIVAAAVCSHECHSASSWRLVEIDVGRYRYLPLLIGAFGNTKFLVMAAGICVLAFHIRDVGGASGTILAHAASLHKQGDVFEVDEELLCKPPVWVDLPVRSGRVVVQWVSPSTLLGRSLGSCGSLFGSEPWRLVEMDSHRMSTFFSSEHWETPRVGYGSLYLGFHFLHSTRPAKPCPCFYKRCGRL